MPSEPVDLETLKFPDLTVAQVALLIDVSQSFVRAECNRGRLRHARLGTHRRFRPEWVREYMQTQTRGPDGKPGGVA